MSLRATGQLHAQPAAPLARGGTPHAHVHAVIANARAANDAFESQQRETAAPEAAVVLPMRQLRILEAPEAAARAPPAPTAMPTRPPGTCPAEPEPKRTRGLLLRGQAAQAAEEPFPPLVTPAPLSEPLYHFYMNDDGDVKRYDPSLFARGNGYQLPGGVFSPWYPQDLNGPITSPMFLTDLLVRLDCAHTGQAGVSSSLDKRFASFEYLDYYKKPITVTPREAYVKDCDVNGYFMFSDIYDSTLGALENPASFGSKLPAAYDPQAAMSLKMPPPSDGDPVTHTVIHCGKNTKYSKARNFPPLTFDGAKWTLPTDWEQRSKTMEFHVMPKGLTPEQTEAKLLEACKNIKVMKGGGVRDGKLEDFMDNMCAIESLEATIDGTPEAKRHGYPAFKGARSYTRKPCGKGSYEVEDINETKGAQATLRVAAFGSDIYSQCNVFCFDNQGPAPRGAVFCNHADIQRIYKHYPEMPIVKPPWIEGRSNDWEEYMTTIVRATQLNTYFLNPNDNVFLNDAGLLEIVRLVAGTKFEDLCPFQNSNGQVHTKSEWEYDGNVTTTGMPGKQDVLYIIGLCASSRISTPIDGNNKIIGPMAADLDMYGTGNSYGAKLMQAVREFAQKAGIPTLMLSSLRHVIGYYHAQHEFKLVSRHGRNLEFVAEAYRIHEIKKSGLYDTVQKAFEHVDTNKRASYREWTKSDDDIARIERVEASKQLDLYYPRVANSTSLIDLKLKNAVDPLPINEPLRHEFEARDLLYQWFVNYVMDKCKTWTDLRNYTAEKDLTTFWPWNKSAGSYVQQLPNADADAYAKILKRPLSAYSITKRPTTYAEAYHRELFKQNAMDLKWFGKLKNRLKTQLGRLGAANFYEDAKNKINVHTVLRGGLR